MNESQMNTFSNHISQNTHHSVDHSSQHPAPAQAHTDNRQSNAAPHADSSKKRNVVAILLIASLSFIGILTETSLNVSFPVLSREFNVPLNMVQWLTSGYLLMIAIIMIASSFLNRRFTARSLFRFGAIAFLVGSLICILSTNFPVLLIGRLISSFAAGLAIPLMFNLVTELMPASQRGYWMGVVGLVVALAPALGPTFGGVVANLWGWRSVFWIVITACAIILIAGWNIVGRYHDIEHPPFDWARFVVMAAAMASFLIGFNQLSGGLTDPVFWIGLVCSLILAVIFRWMSRRSTRLLFDTSVLRNQRFILALLAYLLLQSLNIGMSFVLPSYAQIVGGFSSMVGGLILLPGSVIPSLLNPWFGKLYDQHGARLPLFIGAGFLLAGTILFSCFGMHLTVWMMICFYLLTQTGHRISFNNTMTEAIAAAAPERHADATAVLQTAQQYAGSIGTIILSSIMDFSQRQASGPSDPRYTALTAQGATHAFIFTAIIAAMIAILYAILLLKKNWRKPIPEPKEKDESLAH